MRGRMREQVLLEKAEEIVRKLSLDEKIGMIHGAQLFQTAGVERLGIPPLKMSDGPMGVRAEFAPAKWELLDLNDDFVTYLPCNSALASTWNTQLAREMGKVLGEEARGRGKDVILAPGVNIKRSPLCGRNFEYFSEDPYLTAELAVPFIEGVQECDVAACVKHFALNNQETERLWVEVEVEEQALREIYLPAFKAAVQRGNAYSIMGAYNLYKGEHCCQNKILLNDILRKEWGYEGVVISDWGAVHDTDAAALSQLDIEMSVTDNFDEYFMAQPLKEKVLQGTIAETVIDEKVRRILMLMMKLHMLDGERKSGAYNTAEHRKTALTIARESVVLLKNEEQLLPLAPEKIKRVLVIGDNATRVHSNGGGSAEIKALYEVTPLMGIKMLLGGNVEVHFAQGYCCEEKAETEDVNWQADSLENGGGGSKSAVVDKQMQMQQQRQQLRSEAVALAAEYEHVIYVGGLNHNQDSEGNDRKDMKLPYAQDELIEALLAVNQNIVIVMMGGSPVEMGRWIKQAKALVWHWYAGMEGGSALAEVLFGKINPSGKLPETFYKKHTDCSAHKLGEFPGDKKVRYKEGTWVGYRYNETFLVEPEFCFGHGLSYTTFLYEQMTVKRMAEGSLIECMITNNGDVSGAEIVQVYLGTDKGKELKGFDKVELQPGERQKVSVLLEADISGREVSIGSSLTDIRLVHTC